MTLTRSRTLRTALLAAASLLAIPASAAKLPPDAAALVEKHVAWLGGWTALDGVHDLTLEGTIRAAGLTGTIAVASRRDGRERTDLDLKVMKSVEILSGPDAWETNASGQVEPTGRDKATRARRALERTFGRHLRGEGVGVSLAGREEREGRAWAVVRFAYPDGDTFELLVDPATGESVFSRSVEDGRPTVTRLSDFRTVGGLRFPYRQDSEGESPAEAQSVTWEKVVVNSGIDDSRFARPAAGASVVRLPQGRRATDWTPVDLHQRRYVYLRGEVNGVSTDVVLDSGAGVTVLDRALADKLNLRGSGDLEARGTGGNVSASIVTGVTLKIGGAEIGPLSAAVIDLSDITRRFGRPMPVILGKELFNAVVVDLDYPASRIRFLDPASFRYEGPGRKLDLIPAEDGHKSLKLSIEGGDPVVVGLDTGQGGALSVYRHYADARGFLSGRPVSEARGGGVGGVTTMKIATLRSVTLAGYDLRGVPAAFQATDVRGAFDTKRQEGNLGAGILSRFRVLFDYSRTCLWLEPGPSFDAPFPKDKSGLSLLWADGALTVFFVAPGSPAAEAGWKEGERVTALDGEPASADWWKSYVRWTDAKAGTEIRLTLADGTERRLVLREYF